MQEVEQRQEQLPRMGVSDIKSLCLYTPTLTLPHQGGGNLIMGSPRRVFHLSLFRTNAAWR